MSLVIASRLAFLAIDGDTVDTLQRFHAVLSRKIDALLDDFYAHLQTIPELAGLFASPQRIAHAKEMQKQHWLNSVFAGKFDDHYFANVSAIGKVHQRIGLQPHWYSAGYALVLNRLFTLAIETLGKKPAQLSKLIAAINKVAFLDMGLATAVYIESAETAKACLVNQELALMADALESEVEVIVTGLSAAAVQVEDAVRALAVGAEENSGHSSEVAFAANQITASIQTVSAAASQLSTSVGEIGGKVRQSAEIAQAAKEQAKATDTMITSLSGAVAKIGQVVSLINDIASQTNLLALNATIEAARAGEAGKGFAVVAGEVKSLANQTARATNEIAQQISAVQNATRSAVAAIGQISDTIDRINDVSASIAAAVDQQDAATAEIARNTREAARGTEDVSATIAGLSRTTSQTGQTVGELLGRSEILARTAHDLDRQMQRFVAGIRAR